MQHSMPFVSLKGKDFTFFFYLKDNVEVLFFSGSVLIIT